jgi:hypothetical protein
MLFLVCPSLLSTILLYHRMFQRPFCTDPFTQTQFPDVDAKLFDALLSYGAARARALSDHEAQRIREIQPFVEREVATTRKSHANAEMVARAQADELRYGSRAAASDAHQSIRVPKKRLPQLSSSFNFVAHTISTLIMIISAFSFPVWQEKYV